MTTLDERERALEYGFAHGEELRFLAAREGARALAAWAAGRMDIEPEPYAATVVAAMLSGTGPAGLAGLVAGDLHRAGVRETVAHAETVLERATAQAYGALHDSRRG